MMFGSVGEKDVGSQIAIVLLGFIRLTLLILCLCLGLRLTHGSPVNDTDTVAVNESSRKFTVLGEGCATKDLLGSMLTNAMILRTSVLTCQLLVFECPLNIVSS